jgi:Methyltransferase domain
MQNCDDPLLMSSGSPWLEIPLDDYERHMALESVGQAPMLADRFAVLVLRLRPASIALFGCAGGNGLDRIEPGQVDRVVAVDINPRYIEAATERYAGRFEQLETICVDAQSPTLQFEPVDLCYAGLLFEYVDLSLTMDTLERCCRTGGTLATVLQLPGESLVSPSPYRSLDRLAPAMRLIAPAQLAGAAAAVGFAAETSEIIRVSSGKSFCLQTFGLTAARARPRPGPRARSRRS